MLREDRRISFDYPELYKAIYTLCVKTNVRGPQPGMIDKAFTKPDDDQKIIVKITNSQTDSVTEYEYSRDFLAAALIHYCRTCNIPLPLRGAKSLELNGEGVVLHIVK